MTLEGRHTQRSLTAALANLFNENRSPLRPLLIGITGVDTSGKTRLAAALADEISARHERVTLVHVDDFHRDRAARYRSGVPEPDQYYNHSIDFGRLATEVLVPLSFDGHIDTRLRLLDLRSDTWTLDRRYFVRPGDIVLVEGVFLLRPEIRRHLDLTVFLHVEESEVLRRARERDLPEQGPEVIRKYYQKYLPAQRRHLRACSPERCAHVIVDNTTWTSPVVSLAGQSTEQAQ